MADTRKSVECAYCGASFSLKWDAEEALIAQFCCFCGESFEDPTEELEDEDDVEDEDDYEESESLD